MNELTRAAGVLVVDDDEAVRWMLEQALNLQGFAVRAAASGREAVDLFRQQRSGIRVAVLDVLMPEMDGVATLHALREIDPDLPVCFYTAFPGRYSEADLLAPGGCALLIKPASIDRLTATVNALLGADGDGAVR
jgi:two-component system, OmpR family, response regulator